MVIDVGAALAGDFDAVRDDIAGVRDAVPRATLKVIVESAALLQLRGVPTLFDGRILAVVATLVVNELVRVVYRGVGPVFASPAFCGVGC
jgi:hypothetical protein